MSSSSPTNTNDANDTTDNFQVDQDNTGVFGDQHHPTFSMPYTTMDKIQYIINVLEKETKRERHLIEYILYTCWSTYTNDPINLLVNSRSPGQGKSHPILAIINLFPKSDWIAFIGSSDKALYHVKGKLMIQDLKTEKWVDIGPQITEFEAQKAEIENYLETNEKLSREDKKAKHEELAEIDNEIKTLKSKTSKLINLEHKILVFLDTPNPRLLEAIMPLLSHDAYYSKYTFVDKHGGQIETTDNILWGWPTVIFAQTIDASTRERWPELARRFIVVNPTTSQEKVNDSVNLAVDNASLPDLIYQEEVVSDKEIKLAKNMVKEIRNEFLEFSNGLRQEDGTYDKRKSIVFNPFSNSLKAALPKSADMNDVTTAKRFLRFQTLSAVINLDKRPILKVSPRDESTNDNLDDNGEPKPIKVQEIPLVVFADTEVAIHLIGDAVNTGIRPEQKGWLNNVFMATYNSKKELDSKTTKKGRGKDPEVITEYEKVKALTLKELVVAHKKINQELLSSRQISEKYIRPLINNGLVEEEDSQLDKRIKIYFPVSALVEEVKSEQEKLIRNDLRINFLEDQKLHLTNITDFPTEESIKSRIQAVVQLYGERGFVTRLFDGRNTPVELETLIGIYYREDQAKEVFQVDTPPSQSYYCAERENRDDSEGSEQKDAKSTEAESEDDGKLIREANRINFSPNGESSQEVQHHQQQLGLERNPQSDLRVQTKTTNQRAVAISILLGTVDQLTKEGKSLVSLTIKDSAISFGSEYLSEEAGGKLFLFGAIDVLNEKTLESVRITDAVIAGNYPRFVKTIVTAIQKRQNKNEKGEIIDNNEVINEQSFGWWTRGEKSDLDKISQACIDTRNVNPIGYPSHKPTLIGQEHIDLHAIYSNRLVQTSVFKNKYRAFDLGHVGEKVVGLGKYNGVTGGEMFELSTEEQKAYNLRDCEIVAKLAKAENGALLALMKVISELLLMPFAQTCHTDLPKWWSHILKSEQVKPSLNPATGQPYYWEYEGGLVDKPKTGHLTNIRVTDVASLYPTMARKYNICFTTVNCQCCKDDPKARVPKEVLVNREGDAPIDIEYWICRKQKGVFPTFLDEFTDLRLHFKSLAKKEKNPEKKAFYKVLSDGLKILVNGGYGNFGFPFFDYCDVRCAELITAYGRYTLRKIKEIAAHYNLTVVYGDTDSAFLEGHAVLDDSVIKAFIDEANAALNIELEDAYLFKRVIIIGKKHYLGVYYNEDIKADDIIIKGIEGNKNDRAKFINRMQEQFEQDFLEGHNPWPNMAHELKRLVNKELKPDDFKITVRLGQNSYSENDIKHKMMKLMNKKKGDLVWYYKIHNGDTDRARKLEQRDGGYIAHQNPNNISYEKAIEDAYGTFAVLLEKLNLNPDDLFNSFIEEVPKDTDPHQTTFLGEGAAEAEAATATGKVEGEAA